MNHPVRPSMEKHAANGQINTCEWIETIQKVTAHAFDISADKRSASTSGHQQQAWSESDLEYVAVLGEK